MSVKYQRYQGEVEKFCKSLNELPYENRWVIDQALLYAHEIYKKVDGAKEYVTSMVYHWLAQRSLKNNKSLDTLEQIIEHYCDDETYSHCICFEDFEFQII